MASTKTKVEREQADPANVKKRSDGRAPLEERPIGFNAADFVGAGNTLLNGPKLIENQKLSITIPRWDGTAPPTMTDKLTLKLDIGDGNGFVDVFEHEFTVPGGGSDYLEVFPYPIDISIRLLPLDAPCQLQYRMDYYNTSDDSSPIASFHCDQVKPANGLPPGALTITNPMLDDTSLPPGEMLEVTIPPYNWKTGDFVAIYLVDAADIPEDPSHLTPLHWGAIADPGTAGTVVELDGDTIRALGDTEGVFIYVLIDAALNESLVSLWTKVSLTWGELPSGFFPPTVPQATPGPLVLEHARDGVIVKFKRYTGYKGGDTLDLEWGSSIARQRFPIPDNGAENIEIEVTPGRVMLLEYGETTTGVKATEVKYTVSRRGREFAPQTTTINVNFQVTIPWLPWPPAEDWPVPVHPGLLKGTVKNHDDARTNQLTRDDKGEWVSGL